jgi:hypothetical protein
MAGGNGDVVDQTGVTGTNDGKKGKTGGKNGGKKGKKGKKGKNGGADSVVKDPLAVAIPMLPLGSFVPAMLREDPAGTEIDPEPIAFSSPALANLKS